MASKRKVSNPLALAVMALLYERPMHPYEMVSVMRERGKHESVRLRYSSLYSVVEALVREGLISPRETVREGRRPERTVYELTDEGRVEFLRWLRELLSDPAKEYTQFAAGLTFLPALLPDEAAELLDERVRRLEEEVGGDEVRSGFCHGGGSAPALPHRERARVDLARGRAQVGPRARPRDLGRDVGRDGRVGRLPRGSRRGGYEKEESGV